jgi:hypothetical protein
MVFRPATKRALDATITRVHDDVHLIADDVAIPIAEADRADTEKAFAVINRLRDRALKAMKDGNCDVAGEDDKVVVSFDYRLENGHAVVQVAQVAE